MARITKSSVLGLTDNDGDIRISKAVILALTTISQPVLISNAYVLALTAMSDCHTKFCQCYKITRRDGISFAFTTHNEPIDFNSATFTPCYSFSPTASETGIMANRGVGDVEINGIIGQDYITEHDLAHGLFDGAIVDVYRVEWGESRAGSKRLIRGIISSVSVSKTRYSMQVLTIGQKFDQTPLIDVYTPACRYELGVSPCPFDISTLEYNGTVTGVPVDAGINRSRYRQFFDSAITETNGYYSLGKIVWVTGNNAGITSEIKTYDSTTDAIVLWNPMPFKIEIGDTYTMTPGCDKTRTHHTIKFGLTMDSFGGFPDLPGNDALMRTPDAR